MDAFPSFDTYFEGLHGYTPFPWQLMLAKRVCDAGAHWPEAIDLPTASGKTACMDVAIWALARQATLPFGQRTAPRRIWFVVDRRIVVDEAFERAKKIASKLSRAREGPLRVVADRLRQLGGIDKCPLAVGKLRGGVIQDDGWARIPSQPSVLTSTVDQLGSRLLFRGYGFSDSQAPIQAGLAGNDSLIILDEGHCSVPFYQTLCAVRSFRQPRWTETDLPSPFEFTVMSATLAKDTEGDRFPSDTERSDALNHKLLSGRSGACKPAQLIEVKGAAKTKKSDVSLGKHCSDDPLVLHAAVEAWRFVRSQKQRVAVMVNRVATAELIHRQLLQDAREEAEVVLLTGRMRPYDSSKIIAQWHEQLKAGAETRLNRAIILVTTQCLEVGADYSFDALVTECASLDALRQRFGRLNRLGNLHEAPARILRREGGKKKSEKEPDPIYGPALNKTWEWLWEQSKAGEASVDFGIAAMDELLCRAPADGLYAQSEDAPVLLPSHLDMLCQTAPKPDPQPDVDLFLHGKDRKSAEASVIWRADLEGGGEGATEDLEGEWIEAVAMVPPVSTEALSVPLYRLKQWLADQASPDLGGDVEGERKSAKSDMYKDSVQVPFLLWRGAHKADHEDDWGSRISYKPEDIRPGDRVVLPAWHFDINGLGQVGDRHGLGRKQLDLAECAGMTLRKEHVLRLTASTLAPWRALHSVKALFALLEATDCAPEREDLRSTLEELLSDSSPDDVQLSLPEWLKAELRALLKSETKLRINVHPCGNGIVVSARRQQATQVVEDAFFADEDEHTSQHTAGESVSLVQHTADVAAAVEKFARSCLPESFEETLRFAALTHDLGKLDPRFQVLLHEGDVAACESALTLRLPLAKSAKFSSQLSGSELPRGFRHEALSWQMLDQLEVPVGVDKQLAAHLVASHHGHARPFMPVVIDENPPTVDLGLLTVSLVISGETRASRPAHRMGSGIGETFWRLSRRFGWWGLAYLESLFRLGDWYASRNPCCGDCQRAASILSELKPSESTQRKRSAGKTSEIVLSGLDGANPLGFLAALGVMRILSRTTPLDCPIKMGWTATAGGWRPILVATHTILDRAALVSEIVKKSSRFADFFPPEMLVDHSEKTWEDKLSFEINCLRKHLEQILTNYSKKQNAADFLTTWVCEAKAEKEKDRWIATRSRFDFTAGTQKFIAMVRKAEKALNCESSAQDTAKEVIHAAVFGPWQYRYGAVSMRWDPLEEKRQYALQYADPSTSDHCAEKGANYLAIEGLPFYGFAPNRQAAQPGFLGKGDRRRFVWPIWSEPATLMEIQSILWLGGSKEPYTAGPMGVVQSYASAIVMPSGRYRYFSPSRPAES